MRHKVSLFIAHDEAAVTTSAEGEFLDDEWAILQSFHQYAQDLLQCKFVQDGMPSSLKIRGSGEGPISFEVHLPDWDDVAVFLHRLRPLYLSNEVANFHNTANILARRLASAQVRGMAGLLKDMYSGKLLRTGLRISVDDTVVNSDQVLSAWLNSHEYHRDPRKRQFISFITQMLPLDASKVLFIQLLAEKVKAIATLSSFAAVVLGIQKTTSVPAPEVRGEAPRDTTECA